MKLFLLCFSLLFLSMVAQVSATIQSQAQAKEVVVSVTDDSSDTVESKSIVEKSTGWKGTVVNLVLGLFSIAFGGLWFNGRKKLKQISDIFDKAYKYTDDKRLSEDERKDLWQRFLSIIGKSKSNQLE